MGRIPYGYRIERGEAVVDKPAAEKLRKYYALYLSGCSMAQAARETGLSYHTPDLFYKKAYIGDGYYPAIISEEYQEELIASYESRKKKQPRPAEKQLPIYTKFTISTSAETAEGIYADIKEVPSCQ